MPLNNCPPLHSILIAYLLNSLSNWSPNISFCPDTSASCRISRKTSFTGVIVVVDAAPSDAVTNRVTNATVAAAAEAAPGPIFTAPLD